jgi:hypothetical protein
MVYVPNAWPAPHVKGTIPAPAQMLVTGLGVGITGALFTKNVVVNCTSGHELPLLAVKVTVYVPAVDSAAAGTG